MNSINARSGLGALPLSFKPSSVNKPSPLHRNTIESTSSTNVLNSSAEKKTTQQRLDKELLSNKEKLYAKSVNHPLQPLAQVEPNITVENTLAYEPQHFKNQAAIANYRLIGNIAKRESVQQMLGVDLFA